MRDIRFRCDFVDQVLVRNVIDKVNCQVFPQRVFDLFDLCEWSDRFSANFSPYEMNGCATAKVVRLIIIFVKLIYVVRFWFKSRLFNDYMTGVTVAVCILSNYLKILL